MRNKIKTINIHGKSWFDRLSGNSYFSAQITLNFGTKNEARLYLPFQYGYGDSYIYESSKLLTEHNYISPNHIQALWNYCDANKVILRTSQQSNCLKRDVLAFGKS